MVDFTIVHDGAGKANAPEKDETMIAMTDENLRHKESSRRIK